MSATGSTDRDLFGRFARQTPKPRPAGRVESNDMDLVQSVIRTAVTDGYALVGPSRHAYRRLDAHEIERVPAYESEMVHQLLRRGMFTEGGTHVFTHGGQEGSGRSVLVPKSTKTTAARWANLARIPTPRDSARP